VAPCNLNCGYCYIYSGHDQTWRDRPAVMTEAMARRVVARLARYCDRRPGHRIALCLSGGEPLMLGRRRFRQLVEQIRGGLGERLSALTVQTNAVLLDSAWTDLLAELGATVGVSIDGPRKVHDAERFDHRGRGSYTRTVAGLRRLLAKGIEVSALCVVQPGASGGEVYRFLRALGVRRIDFRLPDVSHDDWPARFGHLPRGTAGDYLIEVAKAWSEENNPAVFVRLAGKTVPGIVIETDGAILADDALRSSAHGLDQTGLNIVDHDLEALSGAPPLVRDLIAGAVPGPAACRSCPAFATCGGGDLPHRYSRAHSFDNPSVWCADLLKLFAHARATQAAPQSLAAE
jgi:uncharacterized protein